VHHKFKAVLLIIILLIGTEAFANTPDKLPDSLIFLPVNSNAILVEKSSQQVFLYSNTGTEILNNLQFLCSTGEAYGDKEKSGDKKTPEGVYFIKDRYEDNELSAIYGKKAFPLDYPNFMDKVAGKSGNNIWLHGTNKVLKAMDSNGCVAMEDTNILSISDYIAINDTPVIINDTISMTDFHDISTQSNKINGWFKGWVTALNSGSYHDYLDLYDPSYLPKIIWWKKWYDIRNKTKKNIGNISVVVDNKGVYKQGGVYVILFDLGLKLLEQKNSIGLRKLFVVERGNSYRIIGDIYQSFKKESKNSKSSLVFWAENLVENVEQGPDIKDVIKDWLKAWTEKEMNIYASYYSKDFSSDGLNKKEWVERKTNLSKRYGYINVSASDFKIIKGREKIVVKFLQDYKSSGFSATGIKTLIFVNEDNGWKIYHESWKKK